MRSFYRAFFPKPRHVVLGRHLQPFSHWHRVQLAFEDSPFAGGSKPLNLGALVAAVAICSSSYPQVASEPAGMFAQALHRCAIRAARRNPAPALAAWRSYVKAYSGLPRFFTRNKGKLCQCPPQLANWAAVFVKGKYTEAEVWNMAVDKHAWVKVAQAEAEGAEIGLLTESARKAMLKAGYGAVLPELLEEA